MSAGCWEELERPWRDAFELMWEAYQAGPIPVGAALAAAISPSPGSFHDALPRLLAALGQRE